MSPEQIFPIANGLAAVTWLMLAILPRRAWVAERLAGWIVPALFAVVYATIVAVVFAHADGSFSTLPGVARLFANPWMLLAGWLHYLAFDLLIGAWEVRDAHQRGVPHLMVVPCLFLTFMFGPAGWLVYLTIRSMAART